jgi:hypothetical protein
VTDLDSLWLAAEAADDSLPILLGLADEYHEAGETWTAYACEWAVRRGKWPRRDTGSWGVRWRWRGQYGSGEWDGVDQIPTLFSTALGPIGRRLAAAHTPREAFELLGQALRNLHEMTAIPVVSS